MTNTRWTAKPQGRPSPVGREREPQVRTTSRAQPPDPPAPRPPGRDGSRPLTAVPQAPARRPSGSAGPRRRPTRGTSTSGEVLCQDLRPLWSITRGRCWPRTRTWPRSAATFATRRASSRTPGCASWWISASPSRSRPAWYPFPRRRVRAQAVGHPKRDIPPGSYAVISHVSAEQAGDEASRKGAGGLFQGRHAYRPALRRGNPPVLRRAGDGRTGCRLRGRAAPRVRSNAGQEHHRQRRGQDQAPGLYSGRTSKAFAVLPAAE